MIRSFYIDNFKSLVNFRLPPPPHALGPFVCLVGLNGAGKSTVLQALDFVAHVASGEVEEWLKLREWQRSDLTSRFLKKQLINFRLEFEFGAGERTERVLWEGAFNTSLQRCTAESISVGKLGHERPVLEIKGQDLLAEFAPAAWQKSTIEIARKYHLQGLRYEGSTLSLLDSRGAGHGELWHSAISGVRASLSALRSLDMLSPQAMRRRAKDGDDIGYGGERLSAFLHGLDAHGKQRLIDALKDFYPQIESLSTRTLRAGWKDLSISERYLDTNQKQIETSARHINDGLLRVLAVLAQVEVGHASGMRELVDPQAQSQPTGCVLFDEIENGVNPELTHRLVEKLITAPQQVFVTTHNPLILNYLPDDVARQAVMLLYRNEQGHTQAARLFDLPSMQDKLGLLGPGEAYVDTDLNALPIEAQRLAQQPSEASA